MFVFYFFVFLSCEPLSVPWPLPEIMATLVCVDREQIPAVVGLEVVRVACKLLSGSYH